MVGSSRSDAREVSAHLADVYIFIDPRKEDVDELRIALHRGVCVLPFFTEEAHAILLQGVGISRPRWATEEEWECIIGVQDSEENFFQVASQVIKKYRYVQTLLAYAEGREVSGSLMEDARQQGLADPTLARRVLAPEKSSYAAERESRGRSLLEHRQSQQRMRSKSRTQDDEEIGFSEGTEYCSDSGRWRAVGNKHLNEANNQKILILDLHGSMEQKKSQLDAICWKFDKHGAFVRKLSRHELPKSRVQEGDRLTHINDVNVERMQKPDIEAQWNEAQRSGSMDLRFSAMDN